MSSKYDQWPVYQPYSWPHRPVIITIYYTIKPITDLHCSTYNTENNRN